MTAQRIPLTFPPKLAKPAVRALHNAGLTTLTQVARWSREELLELHGMGPNAIKQLESALAEHGASLRKP